MPDATAPWSSGGKRLSLISNERNLSGLPRNRPIQFSKNEAFKNKQSEF